MDAGRRGKYDKDFRGLSVTERSELIEWPRDLDVYCEINIDGTVSRLQRVNPKRRR